MDPAMMEALLAQLGGVGMGANMGGPAGPPMPMAGEGGEDLLGTAINSVHQLMVEESDPKQVSLLGAILNQLTTYQAAKAAPAPQAAAGA